MDYLYTLLVIFIIYKVLDRLVRIPKIEKPTARMSNLLVTGCDTGFGNVLAKRMASKGFTVFAACLTEGARQELAAVYPGLLKPFLMDVSKAASVDEGYQYVVSELGQNEGLWAVINNAGISGYTGPAEWAEKEDIEKVFGVNFYGMLQVTNRFVRLVKRTRGRIVNMCSIVGRYTLPYGAGYTASKHAAEALSDSFRIELLPFGVSVHVIEPGHFLTKLTEGQSVNTVTRKVWDKLEPDIQEDYGRDFLEGEMSLISEVLPRFGSPALDKVVDCYEHAVTARFPRGRYMPGNDAKFLYWPLSFAPEWLSDRFLNLVGKIRLPTPAGVKRYRKYYS